MSTFIHILTRKKKDINVLLYLPKWQNGIITLAVDIIELSRRLGTKNLTSWTLRSQVKKNLIYNFFALEWKWKDLKALKCLEGAKIDLQNGMPAFPSFYPLYQRRHAMYQVAYCLWNDLVSTTHFVTRRILPPFNSTWYIRSHQIARDWFLFMKIFSLIWSISQDYIFLSALFWDNVKREKVLFYRGKYWRAIFSMEWRKST